VLALLFSARGRNVIVAILDGRDVFNLLCDVLVCNSDFSFRVLKDDIECSFNAFLSFLDIVDRLKLLTQLNGDPLCNVQELERLFGFLNCEKQVACKRVDSKHVVEIAFDRIIKHRGD
jgi:hypothetical protein